MKKYRIKPIGDDNEVGRVVFQDDNKIYLRLDIAPKQVYTLELMEDTSFLENIKQVFPTEYDEEFKQIKESIPDPKTDEIDLSKIPL